MPVSPATVRHAFVRDEPLVQRDRIAAGAEPTRGTGPDKPVRRGLVLAAACVAAFVAGFAGMTVLMRDAGSASKPRPKTIPTSVAPAPADAPAPTTETRVTAPPPSALAAGPAGGEFPTPPPSAPAATPSPDNASAPAPSTSSPPTTNPPTTTSTTTAP